MGYSRRAALTAAGGLVATAGFAGCIEERVTDRETHVTSNSVWPLTPAAESAVLEADAFEAYTEQMADRYGDNGVWGSGTDRPDSFTAAYVQRHAITEAASSGVGHSETSLDPTSVDPDAPLLVADACVAGFDIGDDRRRYWLWAAANADADQLVRDISLEYIATGLDFQDGTLVDGAVPSVTDDAVSIDLETPPAGGYPLNDGRVDSSVAASGAGAYTVSWRGTHGGIQSVNGVCEEDRQDTYNFHWTLNLGYTTQQSV